MKNLALIISLTASLSAQASQVVSDKTVCTGIVTTPNSSSAPITLAITWGAVAADPGNLPPYWIHEAQAADVKISVDGQSGSESVIFAKSGGTTRCEWWKSSVGMVTLNHGQYSYKVEFDSSWNHSCGFSDSNGVYLSDTMADGLNKMVKLDCHLN